MVSLNPLSTKLGEALVVCFAHVTNRLGNVEGDFEKGEEEGSREALQLIAATVRVWSAADANET